MKEECETEEEKGKVTEGFGKKMRKYKQKLIFAGVLLGVILLICSIIFVVGYVKAADKYKTVIAELEAENERLSDPVVVYEVATREINISLINSQIQDIGELATVEYLYTDAGKFEDPKQVFGKNIPFTTKSFIAKWDGAIKAGIDISKVVAEVDDANKKIIVTIPKAEILSHEIDNESIETLDQKNGLFNPVKVEDIREFDAVSKDAMEKRAIENGILDKAYENAKGIIYRLVNTELVQELEYSIEFEDVQ